ncbi:MAG: hypothetical protein J2P15_18600, partial [Micromonosporaceae bacterium]|nr:hypothetical protein [Micromonosporaceae bacterium]
MIGDMDEAASMPAQPAPRRLPAVLAGVAGCLVVAVTATPHYRVSADSLLEAARPQQYHGLGWLYLAVPIVASVLGLCALRWWPYLVLAAVLLAVPPTLPITVQHSYPVALTAILTAAYPLALLGVLACAQGLAGPRPGAGALIAGLTVGSRVFSAAMGPNAAAVSWDRLSLRDPTLLAVGLAGLAPAVWVYRRGDPAAIGGVGGALWSWPRARLVLTATLAMCLVVPLSFLTVQRSGALLGLNAGALLQHQTVEIGIIGAITLVAASALTAVAGPWSLGGALTAAAAQVAVAVPLEIGLGALEFGHAPARLLAASGGVLLGTVAARARWRVPLAAALAAITAPMLLVAHAFTAGHWGVLTIQGREVQDLLVLVSAAASFSAVIGALAPVLGPRGALPTVLGPLATVLAGGGLRAIQITRFTTGEPIFDPVATSAVLLLAVAVATGGLRIAQVLANRRAERRHAEQIRRDAAAAERDRLARPIHDGVLQVLGLMQRHGAELGAVGGQLATLAGEQEVALRSLLTGAHRAGDAGGTAVGEADLRPPLTELASPRIEVATPARPVLLAAGTVAELTAAVETALDNVRRHAGPQARAWVLVEDAPDGVRVSVRDDGVGFGEHRLAEAAAAGRLGVAQSMRGRIADCGGTT